MSTINISDLRPTGSELFSDSESYMSELSENELASVNGGLPTTPLCAAATVVVSRITIRKTLRQIEKYRRRPNN